MMLRLARSGAPVKQTTTGMLCHLEATMVENALADWDLDQLDFLFIENVGNLVCPSSYDLGEDQRVVLLSVTEGEDKPLKYPTIFNSANVAIVTKADLAAAVEFDWESAYRNIQAVRPGMRVFRLSAKTGIGVEEYLALVAGHLAEARLATIAGAKSDPNLGMTGTMFVNRLDAGGSPVLRSLPGTAPQSLDDRLRQPFAKCDGCGS
jgi:hydrogenase nickel incorporation protein HypB